MLAHHPMLSVKALAFTVVGLFRGIGLRLASFDLGFWDSPKPKP